MTLALEINDAGLILAADGEILAESPGYAMLDGREVQTGAAAARRARLAPLQVESRYWQDLSTAPLARPTAAAHTPAELAHAQLEQFVRPWLSRGPEVLIATPEWYTREQLALLLGIAKEAGLVTVGLVDAGLAAASLEPAPGHLMHLELSLHGAVLTVLERVGELRRTRFEVLPRHGWLALQQCWLEHIADAFVRRTRFDPLHEAATEQRLGDALPDWIASLAGGEPGTIELQAGTATHALEIAAADAVAAVEHLYEEYARAAVRARAPDGTLHLRLSHRMAMLPGLATRLAELRDCHITTVPRGAAALGALAYERSIRRESAALALVQRLPVPALATGSDGTTQASARIPSTQRPTHLLYESRAYALAGRTLTLGSEVAPGRRAMPLPAGPGISRSHCTISVGSDGTWLEDHSTFGTRVNGERANGRVELRAGDRLQFGQPAIECQLLREVDDHGAP